MFFNVLILSLFAYGYVKTELIDDLIDVIVRSPKGNELIKKAIEKESGRHDQTNPPPDYNLPWKRAYETKSLDSRVDTSQSNLHANVPLGHPGLRGGKREHERERELKSEIERLLIKQDTTSDEKESKENEKPMKALLDSLTVKSDTGPPNNIPWKKRNEDKEGKGEGPNLPWKRSEAPNLPWKKRDSSKDGKETQPNLPWKKRDEATRREKERKELYRRLINDVNVMLTAKKENTERDETSSDTVSKLLP